MRRCGLRIDKQCPFDQSHCSLAVTELLLRDAKHMQGVEMIGTLFQDQPIALLRLGQKAAPVAVERVRERTGDVMAPLGSRP